MVRPSGSSRFRGPALLTLSNIYTGIYNTDHLLWLSICRVMSGGTVRVLMFVFLLFNCFNADEPKKAINKLLNVSDIPKK